VTEFFSERLGPGADDRQALFFDWARMANTAEGKRAGWSEATAYFAVLFAAATCDGKLAREEHEAMLAMTHRARVLKDLSQDQLAALNTFVVDRFREEGEAALVNACAALSAEMRLPVFAQALDIIVCDGALSTEESAYLNRLVAALRLGRADVERVADVIFVKNRC